MSLSFVRSFLRRLSTLRPFLLYGAAWTVLLTAAVAVASFAPELAFVSAVSPSSSLSRSCNADGFIRIPLDVPGEILCVPAQLVKRSRLDFFAPTVFAALVVAGSACLVRALGLWDSQSH